MKIKRIDNDADTVNDNGKADEDETDEERKRMEKTAIKMDDGAHEADEEAGDENEGDIAGISHLWNLRQRQRKEVRACCATTIIGTLAPP